MFEGVSKFSINISINNEINVQISIQNFLEHVIMPKIVYQRFYVSNFMKQIQN